MRGRGSKAHPPFVIAPVQPPRRMFVSSRHSPRQPRSIKADVEKVVSSPLTAAGIPVHGYLYDVRTGKINHVISAVTK